MTTLDITIDTGLKKTDTLVAILRLDTQIKEMQAQMVRLRTQAVKEGVATWNNDGDLRTKAPSKVWWTEHRNQSFDRLCEKSSDPKHPDHSAFWAKPNKLFRPIY